MSKITIAILLAIFAFLYFSLFMRFDIMPGDEGYFNLAVYRILNGELPYRDFFLHTPPVSYYLQATIFKIFGPDFIVGRTATAFIGVLITLLLFFISSRISNAPFSLIPSIIFIFWGVSHIPYPSFNWYGLLAALLIIPAVFKFTDSGARRHILLAGFAAGILCFTKQNLGAAAVISIFLYLWLYRGFKPRKIFTDCVYFGTGGILACAPIVLFFYMKGALKDMAYYIFVFSYDSLKMRMEIASFPHLKSATFLILAAYLLFGFLLYRGAVKKRCNMFAAVLLAAMSGAVLFYVFGNRNVVTYTVSHIKTGALNGLFNLPALSIIMVIVLLIRKFLKGPTLARQDLYISFAVIFSFFYIWFGLSIARDMIHLIPTAAISYILYSYILNRLYERWRKGFTAYKALRIYCFILPVLCLCLFGLYSNLNNETFKSSSSRLTGMDYRMKSERAKSLIVEKTRGSDIDRLTEYIVSNAAPDEKIFALRIDPSIYILANRMPGTFHTYFLSDAFRWGNQKRLIADLTKNKVRLVACDKKAYDEWYDKNRFDKTGLVSDIVDYLHKNYREAEIIGEYNILIKI